MTLSTILIAASLLLLISILASKASARFGIPSLLIFLGIGMLAGSEGIGGIYFDNPSLAQSLGVIALALILFSGGVETEWASVKPLLRRGIALSTIGVLITAVLLGVFVVLVFKFSVLEGLLLGAIVSSTDAAAVFAVLRSRRVSLAGRLKPLLELESGSNDPMAVFLTVMLLGLIIDPSRSPWGMIPLFLLQMPLGGMIGWAAGRGIVALINRLKLEYDGLYPVFTMAAVLLTYAVAQAVHGNGFLAVYVAGLVMGNRNFVQKRNLIHFHGGLAWLMQIAMFLALGLLVFPSRLVPVAGESILMALFLVFIARPLAVFLSLSWARIPWRQVAFISWVGLRGSVPIVLATFPLLAGIAKADVMFNIVFFIVLVSTLIQGTTVSVAARLLGVDAPYNEKRKYPLEFSHTDDLNTRMLDFTVPFGSCMIGRRIGELGLPADSLITLVVRNEDFLVPSGKTVVEEGDVLLILVNNNNLVEVQQLLASCRLPGAASS